MAAAFLLLPGSKDANSYMTPCRVHRQHMSPACASWPHLLRNHFLSFSIVSSPLPHLPRIYTLVPPNGSLSYPSSPSPASSPCSIVKKLAHCPQELRATHIRTFARPFANHARCQEAGPPSLSARLLIVGEASSMRWGTRGEKMSLQRSHHEKLA